MLLHNSVIIIKSIVREYHEQFYASKLDNLSKIGQFLERQQLPKLTEEETEI